MADQRVYLDRRGGETGVSATQLAVGNFFKEMTTTYERCTIRLHDCARGGLDMIANLLRAEWARNMLPLVLTIAVVGGGLAFAFA